jgi:hypothetical protein
LEFEEDPKIAKLEIKEGFFVSLSLALGLALAVEEKLRGTVLLSSVEGLGSVIAVTPEMIDEEEGVREGTETSIEVTNGSIGSCVVVPAPVADD